LTIEVNSVTALLVKLVYCL